MSNMSIQGIIHLLPRHMDTAINDGQVMAVNAARVLYGLSDWIK